MCQLFISPPDCLQGLLVIILAFVCTMKCVSYRRIVSALLTIIAFMGIAGLAVRFSTFFAALICVQVTVP